MTQKVIKPKPGKYKGIDFRSQLEVSWAKWLDKNGFEWKYVDESSHDFLIDDLGLIEVKPKVANLIAAGIERAWVEYDVASIVAGEPPSEYGLPVLIHVVERDEPLFCASAMDCNRRGTFQMMFDMW